MIAFILDLLVAARKHWKIVAPSLAVLGLVVWGGYNHLQVGRLQGKIDEVKVEHQEKVDELEAVIAAKKLVITSRDDTITALESSLTSWRNASAEAQARADAAERQLQGLRRTHSDQRREWEVAESELRAQLATIPEAERCEEAARWVADRYRTMFADW